MRPRYEASGSLRSRMHLLLVAGLAVATRPVQHRGLQRATWAMSRFFDRADSVVVDWGGGRRMRVYLEDGYWIGLLDPSFRMEPEVETLLDAVLTPSVGFLDCGANIGYWTAFAAERAVRVVAVEPNPRTAGRLGENIELLGGDVRFRPEALWRTSGEKLPLVGHPRRHAGTSLTNRANKIGEPGYTVFTVSTVSVDDLVAEEFPDPETPIVVKLDVEGAESDVLDGAKRTLSERTVLVVYEDHGQDAASLTTRAVLELGLQVFLLTPDGSRAATVADVAAAKTDTRRGYNLAACRPELIELWGLAGAGPTGS